MKNGKFNKQRNLSTERQLYQKIKSTYKIVFDLDDFKVLDLEKMRLSEQNFFKFYQNYTLAREERIARADFLQYCFDFEVGIPCPLTYKGKMLNPHYMGNDPKIWIKTPREKPTPRRIIGAIRTPRMRKSIESNKDAVQHLRVPRKRIFPDESLPKIMIESFISLKPKDELIKIQQKKGRNLPSPKIIHVISLLRQVSAYAQNLLIRRRSNIRPSFNSLVNKYKPLIRFYNDLSKCTIHDSVSFNSNPTKDQKFERVQQPILPWRLYARCFESFLEKILSRFDDHIKLEVKRHLVRFKKKTILLFFRFPNIVEISALIDLRGRYLFLVFLGLLFIRSVPLAVRVPNETAFPFGVP